MKLTSVCAVLVLSVSAGCTSWDRGIPSEEVAAQGAKPLPVRFSNDRSMVVEDRFFVLPVVSEPSKMIAVSSFSSYGGSETLDLVIVDLQTGDHGRVFGRPVALQDWSISVSRGAQSAYSDRATPSAEGELRFPGMLVLRARTQDANGDGRLNWEDPLLLYGYDLASRQLFSILPDQTSLLDCRAFRDQLLLTLLAADGSTAIYLYSPADRQGRFVAQGLRP